MAFGDGMFSSDGRGHSQSVRLKVPPLLIEQGQRVIESGKWPYRGLADLWRDGFVRLMAELAEVEPELQDGYKYIEMAMRHEKRKFRQKVLNEMVRSFGEQFEFVRDREEAEEVLAELRMVLNDDLPENVRLPLEALEQRWK